MVRSRKVKFLKALTMTALLAKSGICTEGDKKETTSQQGQHYNAQIKGNPSHLSDIILGQLEKLDRQTQERRQTLSQPRFIDLAYKPFESVRNFLMNARLYGARVNLTLKNMSQAQLDEISANHLEDIDELYIEELDWAYRPASFTTTGEEGDTLTPTTTGNTPDEDDDDDDEEDEDETLTGTTAGDWDNHMDRGEIAHYRPRRAAARGRHPLDLDVLRPNLGQEALLDPLKKLLINPNLEQTFVVAANDDQDPEQGAKPILSWKATNIKEDRSDANTSVIEQVKTVQANALVKMFCRGISV